MEWLTSPEAWIALVTLTFLEIVLGVDNVIFISILAGKLPADQQKKARQLGLGLAMFMRIALLASLAWIAKLTTPLFGILGHDVSGRDLILLLGGLFLMAKSTFEIHDNLEGGHGHASAKVAPTFVSVIIQILLLDIVFSLDSVITAVGMAEDLGVMVTAVVVAVGVMMVAAGSISSFVEGHPTVKMLALSFLLLIGLSLIADGFHQHIPKGYIYFAMGFSVFVEMINLRIRATAAGAYRCARRAAEAVRALMLSETVHLDGHIIDSGTLSKVLDLILLHGGDYEITTFQIGTTREAASHAEIVVRAESDAVLHQILQEVGQHGANPVAHDAEWVAAPADGVFPSDFYSTTNLESYVRQHGQWLPIEQIEMDCGVTLVERADGPHALTVPVHRIRKGDRVLVHEAAVKVVVAPRKDPVSVFGFMSSEVSAERPKELSVAAVAEGMIETRRSGKKVLFVGGPAIIHTGAGKYLEALIAGGWIDVLFAGNALATHDIEAALLGTSLGVKLATGVPTASGHNHHLRAINSIRAAGSIRAAVDQGVLTSGVMHACVAHGVDFVLAGSIRDDGPLPDVITNTVTAQDEMRARVPGVGLAIMVATTLHSVATGNLLPATVRIICVDNNTDTITKLMDRGTRQAFGLVTDCQFFLKELAARLDGRTAT